MSAVLYERRGAVAWVTLNRPEKRNAINAGVLAGLDDALGQALADREARVVVLTGAGPSFCAGYDLTEAEPRSADGWHATLGRDVEATMRLWSLAKPTIAAVRGHCLAGGCELAMACDMVVSARSGRFGEPEIRFGSGPVALLMPYVLGQKRTAELLFTGDTIDAEEAHRAGLVNRVVADEELEAAAQELARRVALAPLEVLRLTKLALVRAYDAMGLRAAVAANLDLSAILNAADTPEGREFAGIVTSKGLRAALAWRDGRYAEPGQGGTP